MPCPGRGISFQCLLFFCTIIRRNAVVKRDTTNAIDQTLDLNS